MQMSNERVTFVFRTASAVRRMKRAFGDRFETAIQHVRKGGVVHMSESGRVRLVRPRTACTRILNVISRLLSRKARTASEQQRDDLSEAI